MSLTARMTLLSLGGVLAATATASLAPASGHAADLGPQPKLLYDLAGADVPASSPTQPDASPDEDEAAVDPAAVECMAKVVMHESGHEPRAGQVAVAQTLVNRLRAGRFGGSICAVVGQPGQFFRVASYNPPRDSATWATAVGVARDVLAGDAETVAPGAIFFRAASSPSSAFFRSRERVAAVGAQIFYR